jgi:hypothetical protein
VLAGLQRSYARVGAKSGWMGSTGLDAREAREACPSHLFQTLTDTRDAINEIYIVEHICREGDDTGRRVLGGDDLLPIFIFVVARSCTRAPASGLRSVGGASSGELGGGAAVAAAHSGAEALATMHEWMMRLGASTDASGE